MGFWTPAMGEFYWSVTRGGDDERTSVQKREWEGSSVDKSLQVNGEVFQTRKLALAGAALGLSSHDLQGSFPHSTAVTLEGLGVPTSPMGEPGRYCVSPAPRRRVTLIFPEPLRVAPAVGALVWPLFGPARDWKGDAQDWEDLRANRLFRRRADTAEITFKICQALADA